jgi:cell wall-associated NlpC family hydrolase
MAEHRARHSGAQAGSVRASDLIARIESGDRPGGHRRAAGSAVAATSVIRPVVAQPAAVQPAAVQPAAFRPAAVESAADSRWPTMFAPRSVAVEVTGPRRMLAAVSVGAVGVTAALTAVSNSPVERTQPVDLRLDTAPAAAAFTLQGPAAAAPAPAPASPGLSGADLATAVLPTVAPAPASVPVPAPSDSPAFSDTVTGGDGKQVEQAAKAAQQAAAAQEVAANKAEAAEKAATDKAATDKDTDDKAAAKTDATASESESAGSSAGARALAFARANIGKPYRYGAAGPNAFDCSGLVLSAFKKAGVSLPRTSSAQSRVGTPVRRDQLQPGDLVFFYSPVSHVGIYIGDGKIVHASTSGEPVKVSKMGARPFHNARRI